MSNLKFKAEYAKSGRALCKGCSNPIQIKTLRIGIEPVLSEEASSHPNRHTFSSIKWYHPEAKCALTFRKTKGWWIENTPRAEDFEDFETLEQKDQEAIQNLVDDLKSEGSTSERTSTKDKLKKAKKAQVESEEDGSDGEGTQEEEEDDDEPQTDRKKKALKMKAKNGTQKTKDKHSESNDEGSESDESEGVNEGQDKSDSDSNASYDSDEQSAHKKKKETTKMKAVLNKKRPKLENESDDTASDEDRDETHPKSKKAKKATPKKAAALKGKRSAAIEYRAKVLADEQIEKINQTLNAIKGKSVVQLKAMLTKNGQKCSGLKNELLERVAEGVVLGAIPKCEECGGFVRFDKDSGMYACPGRAEGGQVKKCTFKTESLERIPWKSSE